MKITRISPLTGKSNEMDLPITDEQIRAWRNGKLIQDAMPELTADEREFILSGLTPADWNEMFGKEDA